MRIGFNQPIPSLRASAHTGVAIRPPEALINSEIKPGRWEDCGSPLPAADEGGTESPQPRHWRAVAQQAREWQCGKAFNGLPHQRDARETRDAIHACRDIGHTR